MLEHDLETSTTDWIIDYPVVKPLFDKLGIDYFCGGKSLEFACREQGIAPSNVLAQILELLES